MYYPSSENKGADQLRSYCEADLRLCFRICRLFVFPWGGSYMMIAENDELYSLLNGTLYSKTGLLPMGKQGRKSAVLSAFVFVTQIVQSLFQ